ncbi:hypothetical protein L6452_34480 [Arctium lappa]|uniref:Uncharacterized protein n=1 Tax=Arctium lappa TaxID=4217 RepID=A0ACB8YJ25_ARCLA|nr:hypothetical protein L6452_34480 [Arctium lappa]
MEVLRTKDEKSYKEPIHHQVRGISLISSAAWDSLTERLPSDHFQFDFASTSLWPCGGYPGPMASNVYVAVL